MSQLLTHGNLKNKCVLFGEPLSLVICYKAKDNVIHPLPVTSEFLHETQALMSFQSLQVLPKCCLVKEPVPRPLGDVRTFPIYWIL